MGKVVILEGLDSIPTIDIKHGVTYLIHVSEEEIRLNQGEVAETLDELDGSTNIDDGIVLMNRPGSNLGKTLEQVIRETRDA